MAITQFFQVVENFRATTQGFTEGFRAHWHDHEFLDVQAVVGMRATIDHIHHWNRHGHRASATDVTVQRQACVFSRGTRHSHRHCQHRIGAQTAFVIGAVQVQHHLVDVSLFRRIQTNQGLSDFAVDIVNRLQNAFAQVTAFIAITHFQRFFFTR